MATNFNQSGTTLNWTNGTGSTVTSGTMLALGGLIVVAMADIADGEIGAVGTEGVFALPKGSNAINAGDAVDLDVSASAIDKIGTPASGDLVGCGVAWQGADAGDALVMVKINASAATVTA